MQAIDQPGVLADIARLLADQGISIEAMLQTEPASEQTHVPIIMLTHRVKEAQMNKAIAAIEALTSVAGRVTRIRLEYLSGN